MKRLIPVLFFMTACSHDRQVSHSVAGAFEASVAVSDQGIAVTWYDTRDGNGEIYLSLYDTDLEPLVEEFRLTDSASDSYEADVEWVDGHIAVTWYEVSPMKDHSVKIGLWDRLLTRLWHKRLNPENSNGRIPELSTINGNLFVAWLEESAAPPQENPWIHINGAWLNIDGEVVAGPYRIGEASLDNWIRN